MATYAVIENDIVVNVIVADSLEIAQTATQKLCVEYDENNLAAIGYEYKNNKFINPIPFVPEKPNIPVE
jgi:hypothetical protein